jgi:DNA-directed RNA polymerase specialized sigma24 family protein
MKTVSNPSSLAHYAPRVLLMAVARVGDRERARAVTARVLEEAAREIEAGAPSRAGDVVFAAAQRVLDASLADEPGRPGPVWAELHSDDLLGGESAGGNDRLSVVGRVVDALSPLERKVLLQTLVEGQGLAEVAETLGLDADAVISAKERALRRVREAAHGPVPERALFF